MESEREVEAVARRLELKIRATILEAMSLLHSRNIRQWPIDFRRIYPRVDKQFKELVEYVYGTITMSHDFSFNWRSNRFVLSKSSSSNS